MYKSCATFLLSHLDSHSGFTICCIAGVSRCYSKFDWAKVKSLHSFPGNSGITLTNRNIGDLLMNHVSLIIYFQLFYDVLLIVEVLYVQCVSLYVISTCQCGDVCPVWVAVCHIDMSVLYIIICLTIIYTSGHVGAYVVSR